MVAFSEFVLKLIRFLAAVRAVSRKNAPKKEHLYIDKKNWMKIHTLEKVYRRDTMTAWLKEDVITNRLMEESDELYGRSQITGHARDKDDELPTLGE